MALRWATAGAIAGFDGDHKSKIETQVISFGQFVDGLERVANGLLKIGIEAGDRVILFLPMSLEMYTAMFAIQRIGAIAVFLDSWARRDHLGACASCVKPTAMISHALAFELIDEVPEFDQMPIRIIAGSGKNDSSQVTLEELYKFDTGAPIAAVEPEETALVTFTTGSSGVPKGANRTHRFLCAQHEALKAVLPYKADDSDMPAFPIFSLNNLASGVTTIMPAIDLAHPDNTDSAVLVSQLLSESISCTTLSPAMLNGVASFCMANHISIDSLHRVITGGAPISKDNVRAFKLIAPNAEIWILYGSTEVEPMAHIESKEMLALYEDPDPEIIEEGVNVGKVDTKLRFKFIKPTADSIDFSRTNWDVLEMPKGSVGEFIVSGNHVCEGYYNNEEAFFKSKIRDNKGVIWHRTGDLARIDGNGYLWIVGRIHNMIERANQYFFPVSAEIILKRCPFVERGAFLGFPDEKLGERTAVVIEFADSFNDVRNAIAEVLRLFDKNHILVDSFYVINTIPMDARHHSKVEYNVLRDTIIENKFEDLLCARK